MVKNVKQITSCLILGDFILARMFVVGVPNHHFITVNRMAQTRLFLSFYTAEIRARTPSMPLPSSIGWQHVPISFPPNPKLFVQEEKVVITAVASSQQ